MPPVTSALRECHRLRVHLRNLQAEIDQGPRLQKGREEELEEARQAHQAHFDHITRLKLKQREDEGTLKQTEVRLAKLELQLNDVAGQKEYAAKQSEIEQAKAKKGELEDAILATIMELEERAAAVPAVEQAWADARAEFERARAEAAERLEGMLADQRACRDDLARHEGTLPPEVKASYDSVVKAKGPDGLAGARDRVCLGCRRAMTEGRFGELKGGGFLVCSNCGRILYPAE